MSLDTLLSLECTVHLRGSALDSGGEPLRDRYNNPVLEDNDIELLGYMEQRTRREAQGDDVEAGLEDYLVMLPAGYHVPAGSGDTGEWVELPIDHVSGVTFGDVTLELAGPPWRVANPRTGTVSHVEARARRVV